MYIKRVDLRGFKTFRNKVTLNLERGLTIVTGPNGSGKSNIMDAVKFALGELSPRGLRGNTFEDLISKTPQRFLSSYAYVAIQFDNEDRRIPVDSDRVTISRQFHRGGEGVYRLNGRRTSRKQISEALSSAGITFSGLNMVPQHTIIRLADVNSEERRKILEDMIGIGIYDHKKAEALKQLELADFNIRVASAKIDEVRFRVESLEQERNDLLRYRFLKEEVQRMRAFQVSHRLYSLEDKAVVHRREVKRLEDAVGRVKAERKALLKSREALEREKADFEREALEEDGNTLFALEREIGKASAELARLTYEGEARARSIRLFKEQRAAIEGRVNSTRKRMEEVEGDLKNLEEKEGEIESEIEEVSQVKGEEASRMKGFRRGITGSFRVLEEVDSEEKRLLEEVGEMASEVSALQTAEKMNEEILKDLEERIKDYAEHKRRLDEEERSIEEAVRGELERVEALEKKIIFLSSQRRGRERDVNESLDTARRVKEALLTFHAQKTMEERGSPEERALKKMEALIREGKLEGAYGRLVNLVEVPQQYRVALEVASNGWLNALVVEGLDAAITCMEILKRLRLGRLKIIPLSNISTVRPLEYRDNGVGVVGRAVDFVRSEEKFQPAINFVFGDTLVTEDQKSAFLYSLEGVRAVGVHGDLFEPEGGIESSAYREGVDVWRLSPPETEVKDLESMLNSLEELVHESRRDIDRLSSEIEDLRLLKIKAENSLRMMRSEAEKIKKEQDRFSTSLQKALSKRSRLSRENQALKSKASLVEGSLKAAETKLSRLKAKKKEVKSLVESSKIRRSEERLAALEGKLDHLNRSLLSVKSEIASRKSSLEVLRSNLKNDMKRLEELKEEFEKTLREEEALTGVKENLEGKLSRYEGERERLTLKLSRAKKEKAIFDARLSEVDRELRGSYDRLEGLTAALNERVNELKEVEMEKSFLFKDLKNLGFEKPIEPMDVSLTDLERTITALQSELDRIGAVNQLADTQYEEYKENYKQLSVRINELEEEKLSILKFMRELDEKKREAFMKAFEKVKEGFSHIFSLITNGGSASLTLENVNDPFNGGVGILLRFPGKAEFTIEGASGGEKSVATVCFILALQEIHPMPFYMFDEIDAHLDPLNAQRLASLLKERSKGSQFIIISLKDTVISRGDKVYGIYLDSGSSRVVQLPAQEALA